MSDLVVGVAVLDRTEEPHVLLVRCRRGSDGVESVHGIPCYPNGGQKTLTHQWEYTVVGDTLHIRPSLHVPGDFHNAANWTVRFAEWTAGASYGSRRQMLEAVNHPTQERLHD